MDIRVSKISGEMPLDLTAVRKVLTSSDLTDAQKTQFLRTNSTQIKSLVDTKITGPEFQTLMEKRPLIIFKPLKNSFTKAGDKKILAKTLNIKPTLVDAYINDVTENMKSVSGIGRFSADEIKAVKTYVYRHGTKQQLIDTLDYELAHAKDILTVLYETLEYNSGGVADYFMRPIHRLDNSTMYNVYNTIDKHLTQCEANGSISAQRHKDTAEWALAKIYQIQNNQKLQNAVKLYKELQ